MALKPTPPVGLVAEVEAWSSRPPSTRDKPAKDMRTTTFLQRGQHRCPRGPWIPPSSLRLGWPSSQLGKTIALWLGAVRG